MTVKKSKKTQSASILYFFLIAMIFGNFAMLYLLHKKFLVLEDNIATHNEAILFLKNKKVDTYEVPSNSENPDNRKLDEANYTTIPLKERLKFSNYFFCSEEEEKSVMKFSPAGFIRIWPNTLKDRMIAINKPNSDSGYFSIRGNEVRIQHMEDGISKEFVAKEIEVDKNKMIVALTIESQNFSILKCPPIYNGLD